MLTDLTPKFCRFLKNIHTWRYSAQCWKEYFISWVLWSCSWVDKGHMIRRLAFRSDCICNALTCTHQSVPVFYSLLLKSLLGGYPLNPFGFLFFFLVKVLPAYNLILFFKSRTEVHASFPFPFRHIWVCPEAWYGGEESETGLHNGPGSGQPGHWGGVTETELGHPLHMLGAHHCQLAPYPRTSFSFRKL